MQILFFYVSESGGGSLRRYETVVLGESLTSLRKMCKILFDRLVWLEEHRRFAGSDQAKKTEEVRQHLKQWSEQYLVASTLALVDEEATSKAILYVSYYFVII